MNCKEICELLTAYLDGEVTKEEKARVESHLPDCPQCKAELEALKATQASLRGVLTSMAEEAAPSTEAWEHVRAKIERKGGWFEGLRNILTNQKWHGVMVTAAVVIVAVAAAMWQGSGADQAPLITVPAQLPDVPSAVPAPTPTAPMTTPTTPPGPTSGPGPAGPTAPTTTPTTPTPAPITPTTPTTPTVTVPAPAPITPPTPTPPPPATTTPPTTTPPTVTTTPPNITIGAPPPAQVTVNPPNITVQSPPPASTPGPIVVVSVSGPLEPINPGGPRIEITLKNVGSEPVANLTAILELNKPFQFAFSVLLAPGESTSTRLLLIGGEFSNNKNYPLTITGYKQSIARINYINYTIPVTVQIPDPSQVTVQVPAANLRPTRVLPWLWLLLPIILFAILVIVSFSKGKAKEPPSKG